MKAIGLVTTRLQSGYAIRSAQFEELSQLAALEQAAAIRCQNTPYAFLADGEPLPIEFVQQRFQAGQVWVAVDRHSVVIGFAITRAVDRTLYLGQPDRAMRQDLRCFPAVDPQVLIGFNTLHRIT
jgi:Na+/H+-translocating membrane pyrophosphatase